MRAATVYGDNLDRINDKKGQIMHESVEVLKPSTIIARSESITPSAKLTQGYTHKASPLFFSSTFIVADCWICSRKILRLQKKVLKTIRVHTEDNAEVILHGPDKLFARHHFNLVIKETGHNSLLQSKSH